MTSQQMLKKLGITPEQAEEYKRLSSDFASTLPPTLARLHKKTRIRAPRDLVRKWFGPHVTQQDLTDLYKTAPGLKGVVLISNLDLVIPTKRKTKAKSKAKPKGKPKGR